jgi:hypothetical protein
MVDRSHVVMPVSSSHVNMHNSYSSTDKSRWSNHNAYIIDNVSNIHNGFMPSYSSTELSSHCTLETHMLMSNCYSQADMRASPDFGQSLYTTSNSIRMEIAPNMVLVPPVVFSAFHSASPIYSQVKESSANTPTSSTNRYDIDKGSDIKLTIEDLSVEYREKLEAIHLKMEEAFMAHYDVTSQRLVLQDTEPFAFDIYRAMAEEEITAEQNNSSDDVQSSDCVSILSGNGSASILGPYATTNSMVKSQDSDDMHNSKISAA